MPWKPGESGNPGGRPKAVREALALAREKSKRAVERLIEWMESSNPKASVVACMAILDRAAGKPVQSVKKTVTHVKKSPRDLSLDELERHIAEIAREKEAAH